MEDNQRGPEVDSQDWDWELLLEEDSANQHHHHHHHQLDLQIPNSELEGDEYREAQAEAQAPFADATPSVIRSDYFSLDSDLHTHGYPGVDIDEPEPESGSVGSWMDPGQAQFGNTSRGKRSRGSSHCSSCSDSGGSTQPEREVEDQELLQLLQPHSACATATAAHDEDTQEEEGDKVAGLIEHPQEQEHAPNVDENEENEQRVPTATTTNATSTWVWWKVPLELLKYCVFRVRPVWSLSVAAAAIMGFVLLRRTWYSKMKRKTHHGLRLNITVDDKKVSQLMSRAARLNEAFSVVKQVPIIRPSLPAPGLAPWPVISMR